MIRVGDRVFPIMNMGNKGTVIKTRFVESKAWMVGGASSKIRKLIVEHDNGVVREYTSNDLMRENS
tara:strand:- start:6509 stop:6706 length:198 start_codon:yes stop_codon:yes gene_type:complete